MRIRITRSQLFTTILACLSQKNRIKINTCLPHCTYRPLNEDNVRRIDNKFRNNVCGDRI